MRISKYISTGLCLLSATVGLSIISSVSSEAAKFPSGIDIAGVDLSGKNVEEAMARLDERITEIGTKSISMNVDGDIVDTTVSDIGYEWKNKIEMEAAIDDLTTGNIVQRYNKSETVRQGDNLKLEIELDMEGFEREVSEDIGDVVATPSDAKLIRKDNAFTIVEEVDVLTINKEAAKKHIEENVFSEGTGIEFEADVEVERAKIRKSDLEKIQSKLGEYKTNFSSSSAARATNIKVGADKINGHVLMPGETLSGYECMHPFTVANGYKIAHAYENGRVVDSIGGGACQIATTLYNASLRAEIGITERQNHSMTVGYAPASCDATIAGTSKDIKITNTLSSPIYIEGRTEGRNLIFTIWGEEYRPKSRTVEYVSQIISETPAGITYKDDPTLPVGKEVRESAGHSGRVSKLWKVVKENGVEVDRTLVSSDRYIVSNHIYRRGTMPVAAPSEAPTEVPTVSDITETTVAETTAAQTTAAPVGPGQNIPGPGSGPGNQGGPGGPGVEP